MNRVTIAEICRVIPISTTTYNNNKTVINFQELYTIFTSKEHTTREKKEYLYRQCEGTRRLKDAIWNAYMKEDLLDYSDVPEIEYQEE